MLVIISCFQLPPRHSQCIHQQLVSQWLPSGSGLGEDMRCQFDTELGGTRWHSWPRSQQPLWRLLSAKLAGRTGSVVPTEDNSQSVLLCSSLMSGLQLMLWIAYGIHTPLAALLPSPCSAEPSVLVKACLSPSQARRVTPATSQEVHADT